MTMRDFIKKFKLSLNENIVRCGTRTFTCMQCPIQKSTLTTERCSDTYKRFKLKHDKLDKIKELLK